MNTKLVLAAMTVVLAGTPAAFAQMKTTHDRTGSEIGPSKTIQMEGRAADGSWSGNSWSTPMSGSTMSGSGMSNSGMSGSSGAAGVVPGVPTGSAEMGGQPPKTLQDRTGSEVGPSPEVLRNDPAFTPSNRSRAGSMTDGSRMGTTGSGMSGSTGMGSTGMGSNSGMGNQQGYTGSTSGTVYGNQRNVTGSTMPSDIQSRRGRGQNDLELRQTSLLNQFSGAGYIAVRDFRKEGDRYVAQAQDQTGRWAAVEMDPRTGTITPR